MDLRKYILETDRIISAPVTGDDFDFQINESLSIECMIVEHTDESYTIEVDQTAWDMLSEMDLISEAQICTECGMGTLYMVGENKMRCDECGYSVTMETAEDTRKTTENFAVSFYARNPGVEPKEVVKVITVTEPDFRPEYLGKPLTPEYVRAEIRNSAIAREMEAKGYRIDRTLANWKGSIEDAIAELETRAANPPNPDIAPHYKIALSQLRDAQSKIAQSAGIMEAEYQGRQVTLGKPSAGDVKKYKVYVKDPKTGNIKKVNFGDKSMSIKRDNPARRKNFRARHNCASKKDRTSAGYWSCRMWSTKPVSQILKGK